MSLSSTLFGKKYSATNSYDYVAPDYSFYDEFQNKLLQQAATAPEVNLSVGGYTPYGKITGVEDTGQGMNKYTMREVLDPTYNLLGREFEGETWQTPSFFLRATGQLTGGPDLSSAMLEKGGLLQASEMDDVTKQWLKAQNYMTERENLGDTDLYGYYTPYEMVAGLHTGQGSDIGFDPSKGFDYSGQKKTVGKRATETHYFDPEWQAVRRYTVGDESPLLHASGLTDIPTLEDTAGWDWQDNTIYDPYYGYFTTDAPGSEYDYVRNQGSKTQKWRKGGIAGPLGALLSFTPLAPLGMTLTAANALANNNPLGAALAFLPMGLDKLGVTSSLANTYSGLTNQAANSALVQGLTQGTIGAGVGGLSALASGGDFGQGALTGGLAGGLGGSISTALGNNFVDSGTLGAKYINPAINKTLTSAAVAGLMGKDAELAAKNALLKSAWGAAGKEAGKTAKNIWNSVTA